MIAGAVRVREREEQTGKLGGNGRRGVGSGCLILNVRDEPAFKNKLALLVFLGVDERTVLIIVQGNESRNTGECDANWEGKAYIFPAKDCPALDTIDVSDSVQSGRHGPIGGFALHNVHSMNPENNSIAEVRHTLRHDGMNK